MANHKDNLIVGLDIGTTKVCAIVGERSDKGIDIVGIGTAESKGLRKGVVINIDLTVQAISKAIEEAELMAGCEISSVYAGIAGGHIRGFNSHGVVAVGDREVRTQDVDRVIDAAKAVAIPMDREVLHVLPKEFIVDDQDEIKDPVGMSGVRLEAKVHIVTAAVTSAQNIVKCANKCGLTVEDIVLEQLASAEAILTPDEKELGVALIDIGGGTTDIVLFAQGAIQHTSVIALGGQHFTNDIAVGVRTPTVEAEKIKCEYGCAARELANDAVIDVPSVGGRSARKISKHLLSEIIEPRAEELFSLAKREIDRSGFSHLLGSGIVITGGSSMLEGMSDVAEKVFDLPVRLGVPQNIGGLVDVVSSPRYATSVGLVQYGAKQSQSGHQKHYREKSSGPYLKVSDRVKQWFGEFF